MKRNEQSLGLVKCEFEDLPYLKSSNESSTLINLDTFEHLDHSPQMNLHSFEELPSLSSYIFQESTPHSIADDLLA